MLLKNYDTYLGRCKLSLHFSERSSQFSNNSFEKLLIFEENASLCLMVRKKRCSYHLFRSLAVSGFVKDEKEEEALIWWSFMVRDVIPSGDEQSEKETIW